MKRRSLGAQPGSLVRYGLHLSDLLLLASLRNRQRAWKRGGTLGRSADLKPKHTFPSSTSHARLSRALAVIWLASASLFEPKEIAVIPHLLSLRNLVALEDMETTGNRLLGLAFRVQFSSGARSLKKNTSPAFGTDVAPPPGFEDVVRGTHIVSGLELNQSIDAVGIST